jgi:hypothetical protein
MRARSSGQSTFVFRPRTHLQPLPSGRTNTITDAEWEQRAGQGFSGKTTAGSDGLRRALPHIREGGIEVT